MKRTLKICFSILFVIIVCLLFYYGRGGYIKPDNVKILNLSENETSVSFDVKIEKPEFLYAAIGKDICPHYDSDDEDEEIYIRCNVGKKIRLLSKVDLKMLHFEIEKNKLKSTGAKEIYYGQGAHKILIWKENS